MPPRSIEEYQVGWVCALPTEMAAARAMLDEEHGPIPAQVAQDRNNYVLGRVCNHNVVVACLPAGVDGNNAAATVATNMLRTFTGLQFGLIVGIGGGIPNLNKGVDIRLGDVVVSQPDKTHGGVLRYDKGKSLEGGQFERKGSLNKPPSLLLTALASLQAQHEMYGSQISIYLTHMAEQHPYMEENGYTFPGPEQDCLYCADCKLTGNNSCDNCQGGKVRRKERRLTKPIIHYGIIASGNQVVKDSAVRDRLGKEFEAKCVEMEAAGLMDDFPCLVIRGVCDYADAHKNDVWHRYAATTAAAYAKEFLSIVPPQAVLQISCALEVKKYNLGLNLFDAPDMGDDLFIGREAELQKMESILQSQSDSPGSNRKVLILGGMGGIGKTQLAITYVKRHLHSYSSIFWLNANSEATLNKSLRAVANRILPLETVSELDNDQVWIYVSNWLSELHNTRWLLIFDNYDDTDQYNITEYYPSVAQGLIIITTRTPGDLRGEQIKIKHMTEEEDGLRILATRSGRQIIQSDPGARSLARRLNGFPLALATAGAFLKQTPVDCTTYLQRYEETWQVTRTHVSQLPEYPSRTLYTTWSLSLARIEQEIPQAVQLLAFLAYLDHQDIWYNLLCVDQDVHQPSWFRELTSHEFTFIETMTVLTRYCLVETHYETNSYSLHTCVHDWTLDGLNRDVDASQYWLAFDCVASHFGAEDWDHLSAIQYQRFTGHARRLVHDRFRQAANHDNSIRTRLDQVVYLAELLRQQLQHSAAKQMYERALAGSEKALGADHTSTLDTVNNLGSLYRAQGRLAEAEQMYERALAGFEKALGADHTSTLDIVNNLGLLYVDQGRLAEAEQMYERALAGSEKALGADHTSTLDTVNNLGSLYHAQGRLAEAEQMYERALAGYEKASLSHIIAALNTTTNLGVLYYDQGKMGQAKAMFQRATLGREKMLGPRHPHTLKVVNYLRQLDVKVSENKDQNTDVDHDLSRKRDRWKNLLRQKK